MKLLFCLACGDVQKLPIGDWGQCKCGTVRARYLGDGVEAQWNGAGRLLGFANSTLRRALFTPDRADGYGNTFEAFVIPKDAPSVQLTPPAKRTP